MKRTKIIPVRWIPENHDSDLDGVPNYRDCDIFNPYKQDENVKWTADEFDTMVRAQKQTRNIKEFKTLAKIYGISKDKINAYAKKFIIKV